MLEKTLNIIRSIDFISAEVQLRTFGETRFKTVFGGLISFAMFGLVIVITLYFCKVLVFRTLVSTSGMDVTNLQPILFGVSDLIQFEFVNIDGEPISNWNEYITLKAFLVTDTSNTLLGTSFVYREENIVACNSHDIEHDFSGDTEFYNKEFLCFENKNMHLYGRVGQNLRSKYFSLNIGKNNSKYSSSDIDSFLDNTFLVVKYLDYEFDHFNSTSGKQSYLRYDSYGFERDISLKVTYKYKRTIYQNDLHWFYFNGKDDHFFMIVQDSEKLTNYDPNKILEINFMMSSIQTINHRYYTKAQDALSNIGGLLEIFIFVFANIQHYLTERLNYLSIANQIISFGNEEDDKRDSINRQQPNRVKTLKFYDQEEKSNNGDDANTNSAKQINQTSSNKSGFEEIRQKNSEMKKNISSQLAAYNYVHKSDVPLYNNFQFKKSVDVTNKRIGSVSLSKNINNNAIISSKILPALRRPSLCYPKKNLYFMKIFNTSEKQKNSRFRLQNKDLEITLTIKEFLCDRFCFKKSHSIKLISKAAKYIDEKISIEFILKKLNEIDKIKFVIFDKDQLNLFHILPNPNFNEIFGEHKHGNLRELDNLWRVFEFYQPNEEAENKSYNLICQRDNKFSFMDKQFIKFLSDEVEEEK